MVRSKINLLNLSANSTNSADYDVAGIVLGSTFGLILLFVVIVIIIHKKCEKPQKYYVENIECNKCNKCNEYK